jgi:hypothetical protein
MPFCRNCGAQMRGEFCSACGARAKTNSRPWILIAVLSALGVCGIAVLAGGLLLAYKAKEAGIDARLMRDNPGLATSKLLVVTNPDLEILSTDERKGLVTVRQKSTGKTMKVNFDEMKWGNFTFHANDNDKDDDKAPLP